MPHTPSPHDLPPELREDAPWWRRNLSLIILTGFFALLALAVPMDWIERVQEAFKVEPVNTQAPFMESTAALDEALERGESIEDRAQLKKRRQDIIIRRLLRAGPLTGVEVEQIKRMLIEIDEQAAKETTDAQRTAWFAMRGRKLEEGYPRLDAARIRSELEAFEAQYAQAIESE